MDFTVISIHHISPHVGLVDSGHPGPCQVKSSILFSQTESHLHTKIHIQNNVCRDGKAEKHSLCNPYKPCNHILYIATIIFPHIDNKQSTA